MSITLNNEIKSKLTTLVVNREQELEAGRSQSKDTHKMKKEILAIMKKHNIEYCSHNLALLGSKHYAQYKIDNFDDFMSTEQYSAYLKVDNFVDEVLKELRCHPLDDPAFFKKEVIQAVVNYIMRWNITDMKKLKCKLHEYFTND